MSLILALVAITIIIVLAVVAYRLQRKVALVEKAKVEQQQQYELEQNKKRDSMNKSIQVLAQGLKGDQLTHTEAAIRISVLLEFLGVSEQVREDYSVFFQLAEATAHIPMLDKWKQLSTREKLKYDTERQSIESKYEDFMKDAAQRIIGQQF